MGWTSGQLPLDGTTSVNDVPVACRGDNEFRVMLFDRSGNAIEDAETRIAVKRTDATSGGTPITHTIAVKVVTDEGGIPNWMADIKGDTFEQNYWNQPSNLANFLPVYQDWHFDWLYVPQMIRESE